MVSWGLEPYNLSPSKNLINIINDEHSRKTPINYTTG